MSKQLASYHALPRLPLAHGDSTPDPGKIGALAWSTTLLVVMSWNGSAWQAPLALYDLLTSTSYGRAAYDVASGLKLDNLEGGGGAITLSANLDAGTGIGISGTDALTITNSKPGQQTVFNSSQRISLSTTLATVPGMSLNVSNNKKYKFKYSIAWNSLNTTTGISLALNGASYTSLVYRVRIYAASGAGAGSEGMRRSYDAALTVTTTDNTGVQYADLEGLVWMAADGTLDLRWASSNTNHSRILVGSFGEMLELGP